MAKKVYNLNTHSHFTLPFGGSDKAVFVDGIYVTDNEQHQEWTEKWIRDNRNTEATIEDYDPTNPRHSPIAAYVKQGQNVVTGIQHSGSFAQGQQNLQAQGASDNQLANAIMDGSIVDLMNKDTELAEKLGMQVNEALAVSATSELKPLVAKSEKK